MNISVKPAAHQIIGCAEIRVWAILHEDNFNKDLKLWSALNNRQTCVASGYKHVKKIVAFKRQQADSGHPVCNKFWKRPGTGGSNDHWIFFCSPAHLSVSLASVICNNNRSSSSPEPGPSPGQTHSKSSRPPAVRRETGRSFNQTRPKINKWINKRKRVTMPLIAETARRRSDQFSRAGEDILRWWPSHMRRKNKDELREAHFFSICWIQLMRPIYVNNGRAHLGTLGKRRHRVRRAFFTTSACQSRCEGQESKPGGWSSLRY